MYCKFAPYVNLQLKQKTNVLVEEEWFMCPYRILRSGALVMAMIGSSTQAAITAEEAAKLGVELTPIGAEPNANADGSIPAWAGGMTQPPANYKPGSGEYVDPFANEEPLYTITADNMERYESLLSEGHKALLKRYSSYKMHVYPSHRTAALAPEVYEQIKQDAQTVELVDDGNGLQNIGRGYTPFPIPKNGSEAFWNHRHRYMGDTLRQHYASFPVQTNGSFVPVKGSQIWLWTPALDEPVPDFTVHSLSRQISPSSVAGMVVLVHESLNPVQVSRRAWAYNPGQRRVLRAPDTGYDTPLPGSDGLAVYDQSNVFNGAPDRYEWKLIGKREMLIPYNTYQVNSKEVKYADIIKPLHINQDLVRYEQHRVWVIEATLKEGSKHVYAKRRFYLDEDSWMALVAENYDGRGELWRVQEGFSMQLYDKPMPFIFSQVSYDLHARRYYAAQFSNEEKPLEFGVDISTKDFTVGAVRRSGR